MNLEELKKFANMPGKPTERTERLCRWYYEESGLDDGAQLPKITELAKILDVSPATVRNVLRTWRKQGKLRSRQGSGTFISRPLTNSAGTICIGINSGIFHFDDLAKGSWSHAILMESYDAALRYGTHVSYLSIFNSREFDPKLHLSREEIHRRCRNLHGVILFPGGQYDHVIHEYCREHKKPFIHLNPPTDESTFNYVAAGNTSAFSKLGHAFRKAGRKRIVLLECPPPEYHYATTVRQRVGGFVNALGTELGKSIQLRVLAGHTWMRPGGYKAIKDLLAAGDFIPDAIICGGDYLALGAMEALQEAGLNVPEQVSLVSGAAMSSEVQEKQLTTLVSPIKEMGHELVNAIVHMVDNGISEITPRILPFSLKIGNSTTPLESSLIQKAFQESLPHPAESFFTQPQPLMEPKNETQNKIEIQSHS